jgi:hypothetical protein
MGARFPAAHDCCDDIEQKIFMAGPLWMSTDERLLIK